MSTERYDSRCHDLALHFIEDQDKELPEPVLMDAAHVLAQHIQKAVEDFLDFDLDVIRGKENVK